LSETDTVLASANSAVLFNGFSAGALALRPFTIVRTHLSHFVRSDQAAAGESYQSAIGFAVVSDQALAIGVTAVPTPFTDLGSDLWFLWHGISGRFEFKSAVGIHQTGELIEVDSKAMRKVEDGQDLAAVIENSSLSGGTNTVKYGRLLIKLH